MWRYRNAAHYLVGIIISLSSLVHWTLPLVGFGLFVSYELNEDWHWGDEAYRDLLECCIGFFTATGGIILWRFIL